MAVADVSFSLPDRGVTGLIGPNGAGKTTVFHLLTGFLAPDAGEVRFRGAPLPTGAPHLVAGLGLARTFQDLRLFETLSAIDNVALAVRGQPGESLGPLFLRWRTANAFEFECRARAAALLDFVGLAHRAQAAASDLSYGQQKRLAIARVLAAEPAVIALDEPAAGLDPEAVESMIAMIVRLRDEGRAILLVEHNLDIVRRVCDTVLFMDQGRLVVSGAPADVLDDPRVFRGFLGL